MLRKLAALPLTLGIALGLLGSACDKGGDAKKKDDKADAKKDDKADAKKDDKADAKKDAKADAKKDDEGGW